MKKKTKKLSGWVIFAIVCGAIIGTILIACLGLEIAFLVADNIKCWHPDYEKIDLTEILDKELLDDKDYELLYRQTGLTKIGVDRMIDSPSGRQRILDIQDDFFEEHTVINDYFCPFACQDKIKGHVSYAFLENGDILVSSSTHISGWRIGHSGLVTDASGGKVLQASTIGSTSAVGSMSDFTGRVNFMILSPKAGSELKEQVAEYARENLTGKVYDPTAGIFSDKNSIDKTQCAHLVWYAYKQFGIDLDCDGGLVVTPQNIANSPEVELVQVFGFDIDKLWK